ncbi:MULTISPECIES: DNRLRE domain-containing protein [Streptomyces]|uniref:DNRLRE domain-containing protein n=2 Tax=Streptomyces rimosus subsp. rimosus TaxID=132474 RepID=L8EFY5_STRR1|nr:MULTISPECIES: DNRLRE domain-containing protein [Streptomyces]KOG70675.1 hypothetical protein ADK78_27710 [Kitasatospora aureofaciens]MYT46886.1 DNRLRE domain-containing protein [Streptomyces sp. SID5471]KEF02690.1 hypothetical protein DF17_32680 [Streptomyces rimosus]KEF18125.1 hypothetical protein DF18_24560 [Streptomyces rimosus]KOT32757.1 hypothetical protein ADK84_27575 [Streptomyces sp. NRRL WC-3701]
MPTPRSLTGRRRSRSLYPLLACGLVGGLAAPAAFATQAAGAGASVTKQQPSAPRATYDVEQWVSVNEKIPNRTYKDIGRVGNKGYQTKDSPAPTGKWRTYIRVNTHNLHRHPKVSRAWLTVTNTWSQSCAPYNVELWDTYGITGNTTWNTQPRGRLFTWTTPRTSPCRNRTLTFDVTSLAKVAQDRHWRNITFGLRSTNETSTDAYKNLDAAHARLHVQP